MVRIPPYSSEKYLSLQFWKNSPNETLVISHVTPNSMETAQEGSLPRKYASSQNKNTEKAPETCPTESNRVLYTSRDFQSGDRASYVFLNIPVPQAINAMTIWKPLGWWDCPHVSFPRADPLFYCNFTLPMEFLPPSIFSFWWPMLLCLQLSLLTLTKSFLPFVYLHTCLQHQMWTLGPVSQGSFSPSHWNWVLVTYQSLRKLRTISREDRHRELFI